MKVSYSVAVFFLLFASIKFTDSKEGDYIYPCYVTNWAQYRNGDAKFTMDNYKPGLCTHIFYAFAKIDPDTFEAATVEHNDLELYQQVMKWKDNQPDLKILLSFGGWTLSKPFPIMAADENKRKKFIDSAVAHVRRHKFDGIDIDWEYPDENSKNNFTTFIQKLSEAITQDAQSSGKKRLLLTAAVAASKQKIDKGYDVSEMKKIFDFLLVMTYDLHGSWEATTGLHSGLYPSSNYPDDLLTASIAMEYWEKKGMPPKKLIFGIPTYGKGWKLSDINKNGVGAGTIGPSEKTAVAQTPGTIFNIEICKRFHDGQVVFDHGAKVPYFIAGKEWFSYDNEQSVLIKLDYIKQKGFGGAFIWALDIDDFNGKNCMGEEFPIISLLGKVFNGSDGCETTTNHPIVTTNTPERPSEDTTTQSQTTGPTVTSGPDDFECPVSDGLFPNLEDPHSYYQCSNGIPYLMHCSAHLCFKEDLSVCSYCK